MPMMEVTEYEQMMLLGWRGMAQTTKEEALKETEEIRYAQNMQTKFTVQELAKRWRCSTKHVRDVLKEGSVESIGKSGREHLYSLNEAQEAKDSHDSNALKQHKLNWKMRAM